MATAKTPKAAPAGKTKAAKADDDLLAPSTKAKAAAKPAKAKAAAAEDDLLAPSGKAKVKAKAAAAEKPAKAAKPKGEAKAPRSGGAEEIRAVLAKTKKLTSYNDIATTGGFDIRAVRRTARAMRDEGLIELTKDGTVAFVKAIK